MRVSLSRGPDGGAPPADRRPRGSERARFGQVLERAAQAGPLAGARGVPVLSQCTARPGAAPATRGKQGAGGPASPEEGSPGAAGASGGPPTAPTAAAILGAAVVAPHEPPAAGLAAADVQGAVAWMARAAIQAAAGPGQLALVLCDRRLGTLRLQVTVRGRRTRVLLHGGRPGVRGALLAERAGLEAELGRRGLSLESYL